MARVGKEGVVSSVSLNKRAPDMLGGETGACGVEPIAPTCDLSRVNTTMNDQPCQSLDGAHGSESQRLSRPSDLVFLNSALEWCDSLEMDCHRMVNRYSHAAVAITDRDTRQLLGDIVQCSQAQLESARRLRRQLERSIPIDQTVPTNHQTTSTVDPGADTDDAGGRHD